MPEIPQNSPLPEENNQIYIDSSIELDYNQRDNDPASDEASMNRNESKNNHDSDFDDFTDFVRSLKVHQIVDVIDETTCWMTAVILEINQHRHIAKIHFQFWSNNYDTIINLHPSTIAPYGSRAYVNGGVLRMNQRVEVFDAHPQQRKWNLCTILKTDDKRIFVKYKGWADKFNEWISRDSDRIAPYGTHLGSDRFEIPFSSSSPSSILGGLNNNNNNYYYNSNNSNSSNNKRPRANNVQYWKLHDRKRQIQESDSRHLQYLSALRCMHLNVVSMRGDGNCLFRSVSHQLYGNPDHYDLIRQTCLDYMLVEKQFFKQFIVGGESEFIDYIKQKRRNGEWGDDPEIQAICELYDRPAEIYAFDQTAGARRLRTFNGSNNNSISIVSDDESSRDVLSNLPVLRLSYYGGGHYDSIVHVSLTSSHFLTSLPGVFESSRMIELTERRRIISSIRTVRESSIMDRSSTSTTALNDHGVMIRSAHDDEERVLYTALEASRKQYEAADLNIDHCLLRSLESFEKSQSECLEKALAESEVTDTQRIILEAVQKTTDDELIKRAIEASVEMCDINNNINNNIINDDSNAELAAALALSRNESNKVYNSNNNNNNNNNNNSNNLLLYTTNDDEAHDLSAAINASETDEMERAILASITSSSVPTATGATGDKNTAFLAVRPHTFQCSVCTYFNENATKCVICGTEDRFFL